MEKNKKYKKEAKEIKNTKHKIKKLYKQLDNVKQKKEKLGIIFVATSIVAIIALCPNILKMNSFVEHYKTFFRLITYTLGSIAAVTAVAKLIDYNIGNEEKEIQNKIEIEKTILKQHKKEQKQNNKTKEAYIPSISYDVTNGVSIERNETIEKLKKAKQQLLQAQQTEKQNIRNENNTKKQHVKSLAKTQKNYPYYMGQK